MKKKSLLILVILAVLAGISIYVYKTKNTTSTLNKDASNFKFKDTAQIDKLFLADRDGKSITLERKKEGWILNNKYKVRPDILQTLLQTIANVEIKSPVSKLSKENVIKVMASKSIKVEIYSKGEKVKQYYVGHTTQDHLGTYMVLTNLNTNENYSEPFITHLPGLEGFLNTRYTTDEIDWRDRLIMSYTPPQIKSIKVDLHEMQDSSFVIDLITSNQFALKTLKGKTIPFAEDKMKQYITYFLNINSEVVFNEKEPLIDSLQNRALPFATITITEKNNNINSVELFHKYPLSSKNDQYGIDYKYDPDRLYVKYNNGKTFGLGQFYVFGKMLQTYMYFSPHK